MRQNSDPDDQLGQFRALERENLSTGYVSINGLVDAREHQRQDRLGVQQVSKRVRSVRKFTDEQIYDMMFSTDPVVDVATRNGASCGAVRSYRRAVRTTK